MFDISTMHSDKRMISGYEYFIKVRSGAVRIIFTVVLFMIMTLVWCMVTYYFMRHPAIASRISPMSRIISPFALIGLGVYIISDSFF